MSETGNSAKGRPLRNVTLRVSQIFSACTFCKARKIKVNILNRVFLPRLTIFQCDGATPACGGCIKFGRQATCSLSNDASSRGRDYPTYLRQKIEAAQQRLNQLNTRRNTLTSPAGTERSNRNESAKTHQRSIIDSLIADIGALPIIACSYPSAAEGPTLSSLVLATASTNQLASALRLTQENHVAPCLPRESTAQSLAKHYFDQVYPRIPFFSIQGFWVQFEHVFSGVEPPIERGNAVPPQDPTSVLTPSQEDLDRSSISHGYSYFTVLLVLAISASSLSRSADSVISTQAQRLFRTALTFRESAILPNTIVGVQSILFLIQFATLNPSLLDAWYLIGVGMRMCVDLGLHQDPQPLESVATSLLETRRRLWWSMYSFDRSMSLGCGRPTEISDSAINVSLPTFRIETSATAVEVHGYLQRYRALQVQSEIYNSLNKSPGSEETDTQTVFLKLCKSLNDWKDESSQLPNMTLIESEWLMGRMLLLRPCKFLSRRTYDELGELWQAAVGFIGIYRRLVESNSIFYVQIACEKIYWTGLMAFYSYWHLGTNINQERGGLRRLDVWMVVKDVMFILRALSERWEQGRLLCGTLLPRYAEYLTPAFAHIGPLQLNSQTSAFIMFMLPKTRKQEMLDYFKSSDEKYPLYVAICKDDLDKVRELIASSPSLVEEETYYGTPLLVAVFCDNLDAVTVLLDAGANPLARVSGTDDLASALTVAGRENKQAILYQLWTHIKPTEGISKPNQINYCFSESAAWGQVDSVANLFDWYGWTMETLECALNRAAQRWKVYVAEFLISKVKFEQKALDKVLAFAIDYKVLMNSTNEYRISYEGVDYIEQKQLVKLLLHAGAYVNTEHFGIPLVIFAAMNINLVGALSVLLENGADPNTVDRQGIRLFLGHKASILQKDESGAMPIHEAAYGTNLRILLLELFTLPNQAQRNDAIGSVNNYGTSLLHYAAAGAKLGVIEYLISQAIQAAQILFDHGADPLITTAEGWTPLHAICLNMVWNESREVSTAIAQLISRGIDPDARATFFTITGDGGPLRPPKTYWGYQVQQMIEDPDNCDWIVGSGEGSVSPWS
ncbi:hypothetical protein F53441_11511 [Fusarium austroafricanum]|uniref:Xylanolytic transcriptional activator regulatory domain-containing protein n=1 Tax=Fusarium austroafricanum TaxID=2364996 RepID=A0A8H4K3Z6_9HYPO|nr:hypothetical protein F53441_11511 [Fusarium austroafricanum]